MLLMYSDTLYNQKENVGHEKMLMFMLVDPFLLYTRVKIIQLYILVQTKRTINILNNLNKFNNNFTLNYNVTQILKFRTLKE